MNKKNASTFTENTLVPKNHSRVTGAAAQLGIGVFLTSRLGLPVHS